MHRRSVPLVLAVCCCVSVAVVACGGSKKKSGPSAGSSSSLSRVPKSTDPVVGSSLLAASTTGLVLRDAGAQPWGSGTSRALCESAATAADVFTLAAMNDASLCYAGVTESAGLASYVYDGTDQFVDITGLPFGTVHVKANAIRDVAGRVTSLRTWICNGPQQSSFLSFTLDSAGQAAVTSVGVIFDGAPDRVAYARTIAEGGVDASDRWTSKTLTGWETSTIPSPTTTTTQWATIAQAPLSMSASFDRDDVGSRDYRATIAAQLIAPDSLATLAIGDGSATWAETTTSSGGAASTSSGVVSWIGDTRAPLVPASSGDEYGAVASATPPPPVAVSSTSDTFRAGETWNCAATGPVQTVPFSSLSSVPATQACSARYQMPPVVVDCRAASRN